MATTQIQLSSKLGCAPTNQSALENVGPQPMLDHTKVIDKMPNGSKDTFDGYEFKTDWNGNSNPLAVNNGNIFATDSNDGLRFYTTDTIGKDRDLYFQIWERWNSNLYLPNVIGFTGMWRCDHPQTHPRVDMVCFHYCDRDGNRAGDYRPTEALRSHSDTNYYWNYGNSGQHTSGVNYWIGYQLTSGRRRTVYSSQMYLMGMSIQIRYRTSASARNASCRLWNWKPIIAESESGASLQNADTCKSGKRLVIPAYGNTYPISGDIKVT